MKKNADYPVRGVLILFLTIFTLAPALAQSITEQQGLQEPEKVVVIKNDGSRFIGYVVSRDTREIVVDTENLGPVAIPLHEVREIKAFTGKDTSSGNNLFSTRYFLTTNGLSMDKGEKYAMLNYYGPEAHFAVADGFTVGVMTSWFAIPLIATAKVSFSISENVHMAVGGMGGTLSWANFGSVGGLAYGSLTLGNPRNNLTLSGGIAGVRSDGVGEGSAPLLAPAALFALGENISFVFDSFIYIEKDNSFGILVPGLRFNRPYKRSSLQFGLGAIIANGEAIPVPVPIMSWFFEL